ncbi:acyl-CoA thioesterase [Anaerovibrio sp.]|uniref:acyl-CoA thioesterase n=1 Tax=Anaerovibrio sp. TaxID=1872532 RepID=UPI00388F155D
MVTTVRHKVNFYDTDAMSVVHHSNYIRWFEIGRVEFLREAGITLNQLMDDGFVFPITEVSAKYVNSAKFDDELIIETTPEALTKAKMAFTYRILRASDDTLLVSGRTQNVFTSMETGKITRLPDAYYNKLKAMLD